MFQTAGYPVHPPYFGNYDYQTPPRTPQGNADGKHYSSRQFVFTSTPPPPPPKGHTRRATGDATYTYTYTTTATPRKTTTAQYTATAAPEFRATGQHASAQTTPQRRSDYVPVYTSAESTERTRPRRSSYTTTSTKPTQAPPPRPKTNPPPKPSLQATAEDARRAGIPAGYSYKNWDPMEEPILLLGSVFDANSLGKWIYDWTVFYYGPATPLSEIAGEMWLLLIQLSGKIKRAEDTMSRIRQTAARELVDDFLESGERLWQRFNKLLKICENYMWRAAKKESGPGAKKVTMGKNSGCEFVDSMFGRDRELERTEKLMTGMRLWSMRFDANCEEILRNPGA